jgi:S-methylmethionine-dependent homocysteine/selenocysteine methylase
MLDDQVARESIDAGARIVPIGTYRVGQHLRSAQTYQPISAIAADMMQSVFRKKLDVITRIQGKHPDVRPIINLHGVGESPYAGPHQEVQHIMRYHSDIIIRCLNKAFPHTRAPLLYELIPTVEEARGIAHLCRENNWKVIISLYVKKNPEGHLCIQNAQGRLIPLEEALSQVEDVADKRNCWYSFNCFDPRLVEELIALLRDSHLWERVRGMYPNLADAENDPEYTSLWHEGIEQHLASWNPPEDGMPAFIGACCGSTPEHIRRLHTFLRSGT